MFVHSHIGLRGFDIDGQSVLAYIGKPKAQRTGKKGHPGATPFEELVLETWCNDLKFGMDRVDVHSEIKAPPTKRTALRKLDARSTPKLNY
jgi:hypothetical protein